MYSACPKMADELERRLDEGFGLPSFRPWQREAIDALLTGPGKVLAIAPTGGGKSLCYQFPATVLEGTTVVVSPLIALMEDQTRALQERGIGATYLASNLPVEERARRARMLADGEIRIVYVAPERLASDAMVEQLRVLRPPLVAIDEAHCISQWGHDFRPDYLRLGRILERLAPPRVLACTATATPAVREEILGRLRLGEDTVQILRGFARPNLHLASEELGGSASRKRAVMSALSEALGPRSEPRGGAIVYAGTRRKTDTLAAALCADGWNAAGYHAGMSPKDRADVSERFAAHALDVVVATNAFGMGIDRADVRAVIHTTAPGSIEAYYQEVGRAGRDGQPALGLLITGAADIGLRRRLIELPGRDGRAPEKERVERQWRMFLDLLRYVEAGSCRHDFILRYFGDEQETLGGCGHCDVCERLERSGGRERVVSEQDAIVVRKALSGVARVRRSVGLAAVSKLLRGQSDRRLERQRLDEVSTFGALSDKAELWIMALLRRLISAGLVDLTSGDYPMPYLTKAGVEVMRGDVPVRVLPPEPEVGRKREKRRKDRATVPPPPNMDPELFEALRETRLRLAKARGVPAYVVCHDRTLMEIAADRPLDRAGLARVAGMGPARIAAYGDELLRVVGDRT